MQAFVLALLRTQMDIVHGRVHGEETQGQPSTQANYFATQ